MQALSGWAAFIGIISPRDMSLTLARNVELDALGQGQAVAVVNRVGGAAHIGLPGIGAGFTPAAGFLLAPERPADFGAGWADIDVGDAAIRADGGDEEDCGAVCRESAAGTRDDAGLGSGPATRERVFERRGAAERAAFLSSSSTFLVGRVPRFPAARSPPERFGAPSSLWSSSSVWVGFAGDARVEPSSEARSERCGGEWCGDGALSPPRWVFVLWRECIRIACVYR